MGGEGRQDSNLQGHWIPGQEELQPFSLALWRPPFALQLFHLLTALMLKTEGAQEKGMGQRHDQSKLDYRKSKINPFWICVKHFLQFLIRFGQHA